ncbi:hypothetical protein NDU88_000480 [Pleurodeles waltl]|uniref:Uncharacterized protein n=1 Tax=Pleurodeles waltl TaxID=8319 RepID=A0AAV7L702_PLEWA|nr:hypothetical protein NDU88_000480 [Pleurodeles waltl]
MLKSHKWPKVTRWHGANQRPLPSSHQYQGSRVRLQTPRCTRHARDESAGGGFCLSACLRLGQRAWAGKAGFVRRNVEAQFMPRPALPAGPGTAGRFYLCLIALNLKNELTRARPEQIKAACAREDTRVTAA